MSYDYLFKCIVVGDSGVGKSSLLLQFTDKRFNNTHDLTIGVEFGAKTVFVKDRCVKLQVWDTAGQESFRSITRSYYRDACIALLVYDTTNMSSFNSIAKWLEEIRTMANSPQIILVGNKNDLEHKRQVMTEVASSFAKNNGLMFIETSAKNANNVDYAFLSMAEKTVTMIEKGEIVVDDSKGIKLGVGRQHSPLSLGISHGPPTSRKCC
ncbi:ras-related protein RABB1b [Yasminevirus sp. GU-2018]|uniref:Ras-related protein RABB1b n=1 Tax=Yasminevirus sp. GU-2018 TaxID=2420051 RepID=A0A5K0UAB9_9VIRU|nr:ras-related protein RABB1b [Yasminevirus sp. GU-2018]